MGQELIMVCANAVVPLLLEILDSSDSEEDEATVPKLENYVEAIVPNFTDRQFKEHFRLLPETFESLLIQVHEVSDDIRAIHRGQPEISIEKQLLITLWCLANLECFRSIADRFGIGKGSCWRILNRTCKRLLKVNTNYNIITFPIGERALQSRNAFHRATGFPGVVGAIDGCHIRIEKPHDNPNSYINRKGYPSVLLQGICDRQKLFLDVYAGEPGSIHDSRLYSKSDISRRILTDHLVPDDGHLIGDLAYRLSTTLVVGFKDYGNLTDAERYFNQKLSQTRVVIENAFGLLKSRFRRLKSLETKRLDLVALLIVSACILHNICLMNGDLFNGVIENEEFNEDGRNEEADGAAAIAKRNDLVQYLYNNRNNV